jgi:hypothetical protein
MIKLLVRRGEQLHCVWELSAEDAATLSTDSPIDLNLEMTRAIHYTDADDMKIDALFVASRVGRFWMDVQGFRYRRTFVTSPDVNGIPHDYFEGVRIAVSDGSAQEARSAEASLRRRVA